MHKLFKGLRKAATRYAFMSEPTEKYLDYSSTGENGGKYCEQEVEVEDDAS